MHYDELKAGLARRLGVSERDPSDDTLLTALDEALAERLDGRAPAATRAHPVVPAEGTVHVDATVITRLQEIASHTREARAERIDGIVMAALKTGRITSASKDSWRAQLEKDEAGFASALASLPPNAVPVAEIGYSAFEDLAAQDAYPADWRP